ncbi:MAG: glycoside hydrolase family 15 protein [Candidatus Dormiibacterota bacterium]
MEGTDVRAVNAGSRGRRRICATALAALGIGSAASSIAPLAARAAPPTLQQAFDNVGISSPSAPTTGNFDGIGDSFSSAGLAEDALTAGGSLLHDGITIDWPNVPPGADDNVVADGQTIGLSGTGSVLGIIGASAYGSASGTFTVTYTDGTTSSGSVTLADWINSSAATGTDLLATTAGWNPGGSLPVSVSYATVAIDPSKQVASVTLPAVSTGVGKGVNSMHVFDLTVGSPAAEAAGGPGALSYYDEARKDCVGTAADTASQVWYTVADGELSDTYTPTIDNTDVKTLDPIVTGSGFTALQPRDMTYTVSSLGMTGMACRVIALDSAEHFAIVTDFITDPSTEAVVMQYSLVALPHAAAGLKVYLRFNPMLNGHGGGGSDNAGAESATIVSTARGEVPLSYSTNSFTAAVNRSYATPIYAALAANSPFSAVETGFVGATSDGLNELDASQSLTSTAPDASDGNVVQTVELSLGGGPGNPAPGPGGGAGSLGAYSDGSFFGAPSCAASRIAPGAAATGVVSLTPPQIANAVAAAAGLSGRLSPSAVSSATVALGFGSTEQGALGSALQASGTPFATTFVQYQQQWIGYDSQLCSPVGRAAPGGTPLSPAGQQAYWLSANVIKASEDKTFIGATAASLASPWGQAVPAGTPAGNNLAPYFGSYREVFPRDAYETFTGFLADGDIGTARQMVEYWFDDMQLPTGAFPRNGLLNGEAAPDTGGLQLDESADPILAAWQAGMAGDSSLYQDHIKPAADFLVANGPADGVERWEEQTGFSPSTMADEVAGLVAAAAIAKVQGDSASARLFLATADDFRQLILTTDITTDGPLSTSPYFMRLDKTGDPNASGVTYSLGNGNGNQVDQRSVIDQGFLELTRLGELPANNPVVVNSLAVAASSIDSSTPSGTGIMRYNGDGYGDCDTAASEFYANDDCPLTGDPWATTDTGTGHPWPVLSGENGEYQILAGNSSALQADLSFMLNSASGIGLIPEQVWNYADVPASPYGSDPTTASIGFTDGKPDGSAAPLTWAQAQLVRLLRDMQTGTLVEQPSIVADRYLPSPPSTAPLTVSAPLSVSGGNVPMNLTRPAVSVDSPTTTVSGTTTAGATVEIAVTGTALGATIPNTTITTVTADSTGSFSSPVSLEAGSNSVEVAATAGGATNEAIFTVTNLLISGTDVICAAAAPGGGNGPGYSPYTASTGVYAYPTDGSVDIVPDALRLADVISPSSTANPGCTGASDAFAVIDSGSTVTFQIGIQNLQPSYGALGGSQLVDLYVHAPSGSVPAGEIQSTAAASPWNYAIASGDAWNQVIAVDGYGDQCWATPSSPTSSALYFGNPACDVGKVQYSAVQLAPSGGETPGIITVTVPAATLGAPASTLSTTMPSASAWSGWAFTLTITAQNGFGYYDARTFAATPGGGNMGVCSAALAASSSAPAICSYNPGAVPYVFDTIPPSGVNVQQELDPTAGPVVLEGVTVP